MKPLVLAILDGWGVAPAGPTNAITLAKTPAFDRFLREYPVMTLAASGNEVGLVFGEMGNSEVGHLNIGAGRIYFQTLPRINQAISDGSFGKNPALLSALEHQKNQSSQLHLVGLVGPGGVHASREHYEALIKLLKQHKVESVFFHAILDGRDTPEDAGLAEIKKLANFLHEKKIGQIASISGRFYAMDRDKHFERIELAYRAMVEGTASEYFTDPMAAVEASYKRGVYDEEFVPIVIGEKDKPTATINDGDAIIFFNFRPDRMRQITEAIVLPSFAKFKRARLKNILAVTMTEYEKELPVSIAFAPIVVQHSLAEVISRAGLKQLHIAETEKYAHVTFFLNGTVEEPFAGEDRLMIPSPRVTSYATKPAMSVDKIGQAVLKSLRESKHDVIILNIANPDMVAHTGDVKATTKAIAAVDKVLGEIAEHTLAKDGLFLITADHGNAEELINLATKEKDKEHSTNPVPFIIIGQRFHGQVGPSGDPPEHDLSLLPPVGMLADVAPTILHLLAIDQPKEMTGRSLIDS